MKILIWPILILFLSSCAVAHHVQIGEIDDRYPTKRFEIKVSEDGVDIHELSEFMQFAGRNNGKFKAAKDIENFIAMFQFGPTTGERVFNDKYAEGLLKMLLASCPSGEISGLSSIRETRKYPIISGEIVKIVGYCRINEGSI